MYRYLIHTPINPALFTLCLINRVKLQVFIFQLSVF